MLFQRSVERDQCRAAGFSQTWPYWGPIPLSSKTYTPLRSKSPQSAMTPLQRHEISGRPRRARPEIEAVLTAMSNDPSQPWSIAQLTEMLCLSPSALHRAFANDVGTTPIAWLSQIRVAKMARLLQETNDSIVAIGRRAGWKNRAHASRQFKARTGITPSEYRKKYDRAGGHICLLCGQPLPPTDA